MSLPVLTGSDSQSATEASVEMALIAESGPIRCLDDPNPRAQKLLGVANADQDRIHMRRNPNRLVKNSNEVKRS